MSSFSPSRFFCLIPFGYTAITRLQRPVDLHFLAATSWVPVILILLAQPRADATATLGGFALGYIMFIAVYELGYLLNDVWDSSRSKVGRQRLPFDPGLAWTSLFIAIRVAAWVAIAAVMGWFSNPVVIAGYAALFAAILLHNFVTDPGLRVATFSQLTVLRFLLPAVAIADRQNLLTITLVALLFYLPQRLLSYLESKSLLHLPQRRMSSFQRNSLLTVFPLALLSAWMLQSWVIMSVWLWFLLVYACYSLIAPTFQNGQK